MGVSLQEQDQIKVLTMLEAYRDRFAFSVDDIEPFTGEPLEINLNSDKPIFRPPHKLGHVEWDFVEAQCAQLESLGFIQCSTQSMYASATVVVKKKDAKGNYTDFRQCGDYRPLSLETTLDRYPLSGIEDIFNQMGGGNHLLQAGPQERLSPNASPEGGPMQNRILGSEQGVVGVAGGSLRPQECLPPLPKTNG